MSKVVLAIETRVAGLAVVRDLHVAELLAVLPGRDDRARRELSAFEGDLVVVREVRVTRDDRVDLRAGAVHDAAEGRRGVGRRLDGGRRRSLVDEEDDDVGLEVGVGSGESDSPVAEARVGAVGELGRGAVDLGGDVADVEVGDAGGVHQRGQLVRDGADEADLHAVDVLDVVAREGGLTRGAVVDVRPEVLPQGERLHAVDQVAPPAVELVVADGADVEPRGVEGLDRRGVLLDERGERRCADHVAGGGEDRVRVARTDAVHGRGEGRDAARGSGRLDPAVEVVDRDEVDGHRIRRLRGRGRQETGAEGRDRGDRPCAQSEPAGSAGGDGRSRVHGWRPLFEPEGRRPSARRWAERRHGEPMMQLGIGLGS